MYVKDRLTHAVVCRKGGACSGTGGIYETLAVRHCWVGKIGRRIGNWP